uniref:Titin n=1 Tax=Knipowitschia caucasica TaxID=637954 RepID=A0AAV2LZP3_KNICA
MIDPGVHFICGLSDVNAVIGESAEIMCKLSREDCEGAWFRDGQKPIKIHWYKEEDELQDDTNIKIERSSRQSRLLLIRCQRKDTGEIKIKLKNEDGVTEAISQLIVLDKPTCPLGPADVIESSPVCIEFKWRPPKDDGGSPVSSYTLERQQVGRNTWKKLGEVAGVPCYRDTDVEHGRKYCYRIRAVTAEGISDLMETDDMQAGTLGFEYEFRVACVNLSGPGESSNPSEFVCARDPKNDPKSPGPVELEENVPGTVTILWEPSLDEKRDDRLHYTVSKLDSTKNTWSTVADRLFNHRFTVCNIMEGREYHFRVYAKNDMGISAPSESPIWGREKKRAQRSLSGICSISVRPPSPPLLPFYNALFEAVCSLLTHPVKA